MAKLFSHISISNDYKKCDIYEFCQIAALFQARVTYGDSLHIHHWNESTFYNV